MNDAVVILNVRDIAPCMQALRKLPADKVWLRGFMEREIVKVWPEVLATGHDWYWVISDDTVPRPSALAAVRKLAREGHDVVTGYSQRTHTDWEVNLTSEPLTDPNTRGLPFKFRTYQDVTGWPEATVPTWFTGMSFTGMSAAMWEQFPFGCYLKPGHSINRGYSSDLHLSRRLQAANVPIVAAREGFAYHWRNDALWRPDGPDEAINLGSREIELERWQPLAFMPEDSSSHTASDPSSRLETSNVGANTKEES